MEGDRFVCLYYVMGVCSSPEWYVEGMFVGICSNVVCHMSPGVDITCISCGVSNLVYFCQFDCDFEHSC